MSALTRRRLAPALGLLLTVTTLVALPAHAGGAADPDPRTPLPLTPAERAEFLTEMRVMLASVQGVLEGMGNGDRARIAAAAQRSGNQMARATPPAVRAKLPPAFRELGGPTHLAFEELAIRAETDDMDMLARLTAGLLQNCLGCHATYRLP